jgi:hypothetical protein
MNENIQLLIAQKHYECGEALKKLHDLVEKLGEAAENDPEYQPAADSLRKGAATLAGIILTCKELLSADEFQKLMFVTGTNAKEQSALLKGLNVWSDPKLRLRLSQKMKQFLEGGFAE